MKIFYLMILIAAIVSCREKTAENKVESKNVTINKEKVKMANKKVTGIGGIFFKCKDPEKMKEWYSKNLGIATNEWGAMFEFRLADEPEEKGYTTWSPFPDTTTYFQPSEKEFMINYRVGNLEALLVELKAAGVNILDTIETYEYGKFLHIMDPDGNKIELWEPVHSEFTENYDGKTNK